MMELKLVSGSVCLHAACAETHLQPCHQLSASVARAALKTECAATQVQVFPAPVFADIFVTL